MTQPDVTLAAAVCDDLRTSVARPPSASPGPQYRLRPRSSRRRRLAVAAVLLFAQAGEPRRVQFVFTSDAHYGITRPAFRGGRDVDAHAVNAALVARIDALPGQSFPKDGGIGGGAPIGGFDFVADGGDIANREEVADAGTIQPRGESWRQFAADYIDGLTTTTRPAGRTPLYVVPGNHDVSNAVGFYRPMIPPSTRRRSRRSSTA